MLVEKVMLSFRHYINALYKEVDISICSILARFCSETSPSFMQVRECSNVWVHVSVHCIDYVCWLWIVQRALLLYFVSKEGMVELDKVVESMKREGPCRRSNPGPLEPKSRIIPLDHRADTKIKSNTKHILTKRTQQYKTRHAYQQQIHTNTHTNKRHTTHNTNDLILHDFTHTSSARFDKHRLHPMPYGIIGVFSLQHINSRTHNLVYRSTSTFDWLPTLSHGTCTSVFLSENDCIHTISLLSRSDEQRLVADWWMRRWGSGEVGLCVVMAASVNACGEGDVVVPTLY